MFSLFKFVPLAAAGKDVASAYKETTGKDRPFYLSRRFIGSVLTLIAGFVAIRFGVKFDPSDISSFADNIEKVVTAGGALYGLGLTFYGYFKRAKKEEVK